MLSERRRSFVCIGIVYSRVPDGVAAAVGADGAFAGRLGSGHLTGLASEPALTIHYKAEGRTEYTVLLFVPREPAAAR